MDKSLLLKTVDESIQQSSSSQTLQQPSQDSPSTLEAVTEVPDSVDRPPPASGRVVEDIGSPTPVKKVSYLASQIDNSHDPVHEPLPIPKLTCSTISLIKQPPNNPHKSNSLLENLPLLNALRSPLPIHSQIGPPRKNHHKYPNHPYNLK